MTQIARESTPTLSSPSPFAPEAPPGAVPSLARLAYNRLGFGPRPGDPDFNDAASLTAYIDQQLELSGALDDSVYTAFITGIMNKVDPVKAKRFYRIDSKDKDVPALDSSTAEIKAYAAQDKALNRYAPGELARFLVSTTHARALLSKRQLFEVLVDFWSNHFNTTANESAYKAWEDAYVIRQNTFGNFRDMLGASAKSPSMLTYLSNRYSDGGNPNENYGRELMELHTLGSINRVPGDPNNGKPNYTEDDVHTAARILSGWTNAHNEDDNFEFNDSEDYPTHDFSGKQLWLGNDNLYYIPFGGQEQGELLLDILSRHPSTAYFIATKLCRRLVSDNPTVYCPQVVAAGAKAFQDNDGDLRQTVRAILTADFPGADFKSSWGQKVKRPFEWYISAMRAIGMSEYPPPYDSTDPDWELESTHETIGQTLFQMPPPTGYPDFGAAWMNSNQVFSRWTLGNILVRRQFGEFINNQSTNWQWVAQPNAALDAYLGTTSAAISSAAAVDKLSSIILGRAMDPADRTALINYLGSSTQVKSDTFKIRPVIGVLLASPYFQWR